MGKIGNTKPEATRRHIGRENVLGPLHSLAGNQRSDDIVQIYNSFTSINVFMCTR